MLPKPLDVCISDSGERFWLEMWNLWFMGEAEAKEGMRSLWDEGKASGKGRSREGQGEDADGVPSWTLRTGVFQGGGALHKVSY